MTPIAITSGEPAGIGPQIAVAAAVSSPVPAVLLGDERLLAAAAANVGIAWPPPAHVRVEHLAVDAMVTPGRLDIRNARYVLRLLDAAIDGCVSGRFSAMATAPVHKGVINDAGVPFSGHTEYLAERTKTPHVVMMLVGGGMRVALATTHLPLARVAAAITVPSLAATLDVLHGDLVRRFGLERPRIGVAGLNPHAGEGGHLGRE